MGTGIAQALLQSGFDVWLKELNAGAAKQAHDRILTSLARAQAKSPPAVGDDIGQLRVDPDFPDTAMDITLAIETVPESLTTKRQVLAAISSRFPGVLIGSNTSSLSIDTLSEAIECPERFGGLHFFNPVPRSRLIEIIRGAQTSVATLHAFRDLAAALRKESIEVTDHPGFATSRLGIAIGLEAIRMVEEGVASAEDIDKGMVHGYQFPIGPLALGDMVGLDVRLAIAEHLSSELGQRFEPPPLLKQMVKAGQLGRKVGQGFFRWDADGRRVEEK